jgi:rRNA biogenesis protein RRP5
MSLGLKPSYFVDEDFEAHDRVNFVGQEEPREMLGGVVEEDEDMAGATCQTTLDGEADNDEDEDMQVNGNIQSHPFGQTSTRHSSSEASIIQAPVPSLKLTGGFRWSGNGTPSEDEGLSDASSDGSESDERARTIKRRKRKAIEQDLTADMHTKTPESNTDFERLLLGSPNSSYLWIQYMSFQLQLAEVEKAREIGRRAVKTINFREEQEKLNVWIGLLNLENVYGTDETMETMFKDAVRHNDSKTVHLRLASIFDQTEKHKVCLINSYQRIALTVF